MVKHKASFTTFMAQVSDARCVLGLVDRASLEITLKINALLFDSLQMVATDVLSNPLLYDILKDHRTAESLLSPNIHPEISLLQPIMFKPQHFEEIAEIMIQGQTIHCLPSNEVLLAHARYLDSLSPTISTCDESIFRSRYWSNLFSGTSIMLDSKQVQPSLREDLEALVEWLATQASREHLRQSEIWRFIEARTWASSWQDLKSISDTAYQYTLASLLPTHFSVSGNATVFADCIQQTLLKNKMIIPREHTIEVDEVVTRFPIDVVKHLSIAEISQLRDEQPFRQLRKQLEKFSKRQGSSGALLEQIHLSLDNCTDPLVELLSRSGRRRESYIEYLKEKRRKATIRLYNKLGILAIPPALAFLSGSLEIVAALVAVDGLIGWYLADKRKQNINYSRMAEKYSDSLKENNGIEPTTGHSSTVCSTDEGRKA